jgi:hypothetical protein
MTTFLYKGSYYPFENLPDEVQVSLTRRGLEPPTPAATETPLPDDFPGRDALLAAGYKTVESVPRDRQTLIDLDGIGEKTADKILAAL